MYARLTTVYLLTLLLVSNSWGDTSSSALDVFSKHRQQVFQQAETEYGQFVFFCFSGDVSSVDEGDGMLAVDEQIRRYVINYSRKNRKETVTYAKSRLETFSSAYGMSRAEVAYRDLPSWVVFNGEEERYYYVVAIRKSDLQNIRFVDQPRTTLDFINLFEDRRRVASNPSLFHYSINAFDVAIASQNEKLSANGLSNYVVNTHCFYDTDWYTKLRVVISHLENQNCSLDDAIYFLREYPALPEIFACLGRNYLVGNDFTAYINCMMLAGAGVSDVLHVELLDVIAKTSNVALKEYPLHLENAATNTYPPIVSFVRKQQGFVNFSGDWDRSASQSHYRKAESKFNQGQPIETIQRDLFDSLESDPTHSESWNLLGVLMKNSEDMQGAVACFRQALRLDPKAPNPMANLALIYEALSKRELASGMALAACLHAIPEDWAYRKSEELLSNN
jgi:tetratricopeptide (TPR) repeat protein